jgi:TRAP-type C4-dicarboxylate transport system substrate-binding protein
MTGHNYGSTVVAMNLGIFNSLTAAQQKLILDTGREAQGKVRGITESIDSEKSAKALLEPKGMVVNVPAREPFVARAKEKVWPAYQAQYGELWKLIAESKA